MSSYAGAGGSLMGAGSAGLAIQQADTAASGDISWVFWLGALIVVGIAMMAWSLLRNHHDARIAGVVGSSKFSRRRLNRRSRQ